MKEQPARLAALADDLLRIAAAKKARVPLQAGGVSAREKAAREKDVRALELAARIAAFAARHSHAFRIWYRAETGGDL